MTCGFYTIYPLFKVYLCTVTFGLMYGQNSRAVSNQEQIIVARVQHLVDIWMVPWTMSDMVKSIAAIVFYHV